MSFAALARDLLDAPLLRSSLRDAVRYAPRVGEPVDVFGLFDAAYVRADVGGVAVQNVGPAVTLRLADLPTDPEEDEPEITVNGTTYCVTEMRPDGVGLVVLMLREEA